VADRPDRTARPDTAAWIDPALLAEIVLDAVEQQPIAVQRRLRDAMHAGAIDVYAPRGAEWVTVVLADCAVARVHASRLGRDRHTQAVP
jgi:hypothetical protein